MILVTRKEHFNAAHKLFNPNWTEEKNQEIFGKCANANWHGHNYQLFVTVKGRPDPETGYVIDLKVLGDWIKKEVTDKLDHKNLNLDVDFLSHVLPSTENVAIAIWKILAKLVNNTDRHLYSIKLYETENNFVEYFGEE